MKPFSRLGLSALEKGLAGLGVKKPQVRLPGVLGEKLPPLGRDAWIGATTRVPGALELARRSAACRQVLRVIERHQALKTPLHAPLSTRRGRERLASDLLEVLESHHPYTAGHLRRVRDYSKLLGEAVGLSGGELERLELGAVLHDIGKTGVPKAILQKTSPLDEVEFEIMKHHTTIGADHLLGRIKELEPILSIIRSHHERVAGGGYPLGLKGSRIDPLAKIVSVADAFDAMTSTRSYRPGMAPAKAYEHLRKAAGDGQMDKHLVESFIGAFERRRGGQVIPVAPKYRETVLAAS